MSRQLTEPLKKLLKETGHELKGAAKRRFFAQTVSSLGYGGQSLAVRELGWDKEGRSTKAEGRRENSCMGFRPLLNLSHSIFD